MRQAPPHSSTAIFSSYRPPVVCCPVGDADRDLSSENRLLRLLKTPWGQPVCHPHDLSHAMGSVQCASGSGRICSLKTFGLASVPPSLWNTVRVPEVVHSPLPFQPALGSSMRPSTFLVKKPRGYGTCRSTILPSTTAVSDSSPLVEAIGTLGPSPRVL